MSKGKVSHNWKSRGCSSKCDSVHTKKRHQAFLKHPKRCTVISTVKLWNLGVYSFNKFWDMDLVRVAPQTRKPSLSNWPATFTHECLKGSMWQIKVVSKRLKGREMANRKHKRSDLWLNRGGRGKGKWQRFRF